MAGGGGSQLGLPTVNNMYASPTAVTNASTAYTANAPTTGNTGSPFGNTIAATTATPGYASPPDIASLERDLSNLNTIVSDDQRANTNIHDGFNQGIASLTDRIGEAGKTLDSHVGVPGAHHDLPGSIQQGGGWNESGGYTNPQYVNRR
jgi:hypothetical protein